MGGHGAVCSRRCSHARCVRLERARRADGPLHAVGGHAAESPRRAVPERRVPREREDHRPAPRRRSARAARNSRVPSRTSSASSTASGARCSSFFYVDDPTPADRRRRRPAARRDRSREPASERGRVRRRHELGVPDRSRAERSREGARPVPRHASTTTRRRRAHGPSWRWDRASASCSKRATATPPCSRAACAT